MTPYYQQGRATLYLCDFREIIESLEADALVTDPPYGIGLSNNDVDGHRTARPFGVVGDDSQEAGIAALRWAESRRLPTVAFASPWLPWPGEWRNLIVWDKGGAVGGGGDIRTCLKRSWELIQVARNGPMNGNRDVSVWWHPITGADTADHICAKPVGLMSRLVERFTCSGDVVCDPFTGSGSTAIACILTGRRFIGCEIEERYAELAAKRIDTELSKGRLFTPQDLEQAKQEVMAI